MYFSYLELQILGFSFSSSWIPWCRPNKIFCSEPEHSVRKIPKMSHLNFHLKNHPNYLWKEYCTKLDFLSVFQTLWNWEDKNKNEIRDIGLQWTLGRRAKSYLAPMKMPYAHSSNTTPIFPSSRLRTNLHFKKAFENKMKTFDETKEEEKVFCYFAHIFITFIFSLFPIESVIWKVSNSIFKYFLFLFSVEMFSVHGNSFGIALRLSFPCCLLLLTNFCFRHNL